MVNLFHSRLCTGQSTSWYTQYNGRIRYPLPLIPRDLEIQQEPFSSDPRLDQIPSVGPQVSTNSSYPMVNTAVYNRIMELLLFFLSFLLEKYENTFSFLHPSFVRLLSIGLLQPHKTSYSLANPCPHESVSKSIKFTYSVCPKPPAETQQYLGRVLLLFPSPQRQPGRSHFLYTP